MSHTILQIVPHLPPTICGVGDYALCLACQLRQDFDLQTRFLIANPQWHGNKEIEGFLVTKVEDRDPKRLLYYLDASSVLGVLLHYVGYGYDVKGCPYWLVEGLKRWKRQVSDSYLLTMFHEIYAFSYKPWNSSFWLSPLQKKLAADLAILSDQCVTSQSSYVKRIIKFSPSENIKIENLPVFSTLGEPESLKPLSVRENQLVILGHPDTRLAVYRKYAQELEVLCQLFKTTRVYDIGVPTGFDFSQLSKTKVFERGVLSATEISNILSNSILSFSDFPNPNHLGKSTIFASLCSHKVLSIRTVGSRFPIDGLQDGCHYLSLTQLYRNNFYGSNLNLLQKIVDAAYMWYEEHNLARQVIFFAESFLKERIKKK
ncbi:hypothetical protein [Trichothermofontia sp.]